MMRSMFKLSHSIFLLLILSLFANVSFAEESTHAQHHQMSLADDSRVSLNLPPMMKQHQLKNMRAHLEAVQQIVQLITENKFEAASEKAFSQLGMTSRMEQMCNKMNNEEFKALGLAFHKSGDELGETLLKKDVNLSMMALSKTLNYCVTCHARFKQ